MIISHLKEMGKVPYLLSDNVLWLSGEQEMAATTTFSLYTYKLWVLVTFSKWMYEEVRRVHSILFIHFRRIAQQQPHGCLFQSNDNKLRPSRT